MKKVLFVINTLGRGGAEVAMMELMKVFLEHDCEVSLYVMLGQGELVARLPEKVRLLNDGYHDEDVLSDQGRKYLLRTLAKDAMKNHALVRNIPYIGKNAAAMLKKNDLDVKKLLWKMIADSAPRFNEEYDLAVSFIEGASAYYTARYVKAEKKAVFIHIDYIQFGYSRQLDEDCYRYFDKIFAVSEDVRRSFIQMYPEYTGKTFVFQNIIDQEAIRRKSRQGNGFSDDFAGKRILSVGRLVKQKGYEVSIDAFAKLKKDGYDLRWYVFGEGEERGSLQKHINECGLHDDFLLCGVTDNPYPYFAGCDLYVHCSRVEGKSLAIEEAMTLGCPVIVSDCSGTKEQVENGVNGLVIPFGVNQIYNAVKRLLDDEAYAETLGRNAAEKKIINRDIRKILELL